MTVGLVEVTLSRGTQTCTRQHENGSTLIGNPKQTTA